MSGGAEHDHGERHLGNVQQTLRCGRQIAAQAGAGGLVFLRGDLGMGKTCLCRGILRGLGYNGAVKSPTFTVVEPYTVGGMDICHFDLYRIVDPGELEFIGLRDYLANADICLFEWPERGEGVLPVPDLELCLEVDGNGRRLRWQAHSARGRLLAAGL